MKFYHRWLPIKGFPGYEVAPMGAIRRNGVLLRTFMVSNGLSLTLSTNDEKTTVRLARIVGAAFCHDFHPSLVPVYLDGDRTNCRARNLKWVSRSEITGNPYSKNPR